MCMNCGCGDIDSNHGDPLNITWSRLYLIAVRNDSTMKDMVANMAATLLGVISLKHHRGIDEIDLNVTRTEVKPEMKAKYAERRRETKG